MKRPGVRFLLGLSMDLLSKHLVSAFIPLDSYISLPGPLRLSHRFNVGAALGSFMWVDESIRYPLLLFLQFLATMSVWPLLTDFGEKRDELTVQGSCLILAGACGNLLDHLINGGVVDFLEVALVGPHFIVFNIADILILAGVALALPGLLGPVKRSFLKLAMTFRDPVRDAED